MRAEGPDLSRMVRGLRKRREESKGRWEKGGGNVLVAGTGKKMRWVRVAI